MFNQQLEQFLLAAINLDNQDPLAHYNTEFSRPSNSIGADLRGNSLGFMPIGFPPLLMSEAHKWGNLGHDGHFDGDHKWYTFHEWFEAPLAALLGCDATLSEAVIGNTLSVNNMHLLSLFYRKVVSENPGRNKIFVLESNFPSDLKSIEYIVNLITGDSNSHKYIVFGKPNEQGLYNHDEIVKQIQSRNDIALGFFEAINYKSGQRFDLKRLSETLHDVGAYIGVDLAHGIGNIPLELNAWNIDFATWCSYKYLNSGPGAVGGFYINNKNIDELSKHVPGWWGLDKETRFKNPENYTHAKGSRRFLASNDQIFNSLGLKAQLMLFNKYSFRDILNKHKALSTYLYDALKLVEGISIITPRNWDERGCQISFTTKKHDAEALVKTLANKHFCFCENRGQVLRAAPVAYNSYGEVSHFVRALNATQ